MFGAFEPDSRWRRIAALRLFTINAGKFTARAAALCVALVAAAEAQAQEQGAVQGRIKDALDRPVTGASLRLEAPDGSIVARATSDAEGRYGFTAVPAGVYSLVGEKPDFQTSTAVLTVTAAGRSTADLVLAATQALNYNVVAQRLDEARNGIQPSLGASVYKINKQAIESQPQGDNTPFNQVLLQAPGVAQDSFGQLHIRGEHANLQYRINGVQLPEGITGFGQVLDSRFAQRADLITGALPAQYGLRTSGIIDIQTKSGAFEPGVRTSLYGGSDNTIQPSTEISGNVGQGRLNYYASASFLHNNLGIESPDGSASPLHDTSEQGKGFAYLSALLNDTTRLSLIAGSSVGNFEIPNRAGQMPAFTALGVSSFNSAQLNERQQERNHYGIVALQQSFDALDYQVALFTRYSTIHFEPDPLGDLIFNGVASNVKRKDFASGIQGDGSYKLTDTHTLRSGFTFTTERIRSSNQAQVFPVDDMGNQTDDTPIAIGDSASKIGQTYGIYLQDEWRIFPKLTFNFGLRGDYVDAFTKEGQISPRANLVYTPTDTTTVHAGYARYFTPPPLELVAPTSVALFAGTTNASEVTTDSTVKAERANYYDVGVVQKVTSALQLGLDGYYKQSHNLLDEGQFGQALVFSPFNYDSSRIYGIELSGSYKAGDLSAYGSLAYSKALGRGITSGQFQFGQDELTFIGNNFVHLDHDQRVTGSGGVSYRWLDTLFSADLIYGSGLRSGFANTMHLPGYEQVNIGIAHDFNIGSVKGFTLRFDVINLFDETYELRDGTGIGVGAPQFGPRRLFFAGLSKSF